MSIHSMMKIRENRRHSALNFSRVTIAVALCANASIAAASLADGLVVYYPLDGSANDASGNSNNGTALGGVTFETGVLGQAARFNGSTSYIQAQDASVGNLGTNATLSFWFKVDPANVGGSRIFEKDDRAYWWFYADSGYIVADVRSTQSYGPPEWHLVVQKPTGLPTSWTAVALRKTGTTLDLFIDGQLQQTIPNAAPSVATTAPLTLGRSYYWNSFYYTGLLDEVRIYDRALSDGEIGLLAAVPEPSTVLMLSAGVAFLALRRRKSKAQEN